MTAKKDPSYGKGTVANGVDTRHVVDVVFVGGGPATLGLLTNAVKSNR
jgi:hypothetical protein